MVNPTGASITTINNSVLSSITTSPALPSNWTVSGPLGFAGSNGTNASVIAFTNTNVTNYANSYLAFPIFLNVLVASSPTPATAITFANWLLSNAYQPVNISANKINTAVYPLLSTGTFNVVTIKNGTNLTSLTGWSSGMLSPNTASLFNGLIEPNTPSTGITAVRMLVAFPN